MGAFVVALAVRGSTQPPAKPKGVLSLGLLGGFIDAAGGGWGPVVTTTLLGCGHGARHAVGSVSASEFLVTAAISATFFLTLGGVRWSDIAGLLLGGVISAPVAAFAVSVAPQRVLMGVIGSFVLAISLWQIAIAVGPSLTIFSAAAEGGAQLAR